jgi:LysM repeat protein
MNQRPTASARVVAVIALVIGFIVVIAVVSSSLGGGEGGEKKTPSGQLNRKSASGKTQAAAYVVQNGDTLTSIAHKTGVSVARIQELNPAVDPQILISGEKLKLR